MSRVWKVLIPAVGGQGGGILMVWVLEAARAAGLTARGIAQPGLSQRAGATAYYVEILAGVPEAAAHVSEAAAHDVSEAAAHDVDTLADASPAAAPVTMGLFPLPGDVDVIVAQEFLELGRALERGYATPAQTLVIANTHRFLSTPEKLPGGPGTYPPALIEAAAAALARRALLLDVPALLRAHNLPEQATNAVLAGALCAAGALPIPLAAWEQAICLTTGAAGTNLAAFRLGLAPAGAAPAASPTAAGPDPASGLAPALRERLARAFPAPLAPLLTETAAAVQAYHDAAYAGEFLDRLAPFAALEAARGAPDFALTAAMALQVSRWMMYEDAARVAELKARPERLRALLRRHHIGPGDVLRVVDHLAPEAWDLYTALPYRLLRLFGAPPLSAPVPGGRHFHLRLPAAGAGGYLVLRLLGGLRRLRRVSYRMAWERAHLDRYCAGVLAAAAADCQRGLAAAAAADLIRGYGAIRRRGIAAAAELLAGLQPGA